MSFTAKEKKDLFDKLEGQSKTLNEHTVVLATIQKDLDFGSKEFSHIRKRQTDFEETEQGLKTLHGQFKIIAWIMSILSGGGIIAVIVGYFLGRG